MILNSKPQFTASLLKSATKLRVFMLGLKKPKPNAAASANKDAPNPNKKKLFSVKFKVDETETVSSASEEKRLMPKYLKMVKPLYVRVSRKYDKVKLGQKQGNVSLPAGLRKHLGKGRSPLVSSKRRDDSLLQQHDSIQGAILHCKNSFNASTECETSQLPRSVSDVSPELSENSKNDECL